MPVAAYDIFSWHDGTFSVSGWGLLLLFLIVLGIGTYDKIDKF